MSSPVVNDGPAPTGRRSPIARSGSDAGFAGILRSTLEQGDGLLLRVSAYERMWGGETVARGWTARWLGPLLRRSRTIFDAQMRLLGAMKDEKR